jgi:hypothetical protein
MRKNIIYILSGLLLLTASCNKDYFTFDDDARIQFGPELSRIYQTSFNLADTLKPYTFYYEPASVTQDTVWFDIYAIGGTSSVDRPFSLAQVMVPDTNNAVAGTHYKAFTDATVASQYAIKAGQVHTRVPVVLLRDNSLTQKQYILRIVVEENNHFKTGSSNLTWRVVSFSDKLTQPAAWNASATQYYWGKYSSVKHAFMIDQTGERWDNDFMTEMMTDYSLLTYWRAKLKSLLIDYNVANPGSPLTDEVGDLVVFP